MTFFDRLNSPEFDFTLNQSSRQIEKCLHRVALTSHFESFWSIVIEVLFSCIFQLKENIVNKKKYMFPKLDCLQMFFIFLSVKDIRFFSHKK